MKKRLAQWLYNYLQPKYTAKQVSEINRFKSIFRLYFEGGYDDYEPICDIPIKNFGITDLQYEFVNQKLIVTVVLDRPGFLIGKGGNVIDGLNNYLSKFDMKVTINESKLWKFLRY